MIHFHQPLWIFAGLGLTTLLFFFCLWQQRKRQQSLQAFAEQPILSKLIRNVSPFRRMLKTTLLFVAIFCLFVTLARPQYGFRWIDVKRKGIDILFAIDTSKSMLAQDVKPNRLERARYGILDFVEKLDGDRVGLMPFAGSSYLMCPLTTDYQAFESSLLAVNTKTIPKGGTNIPELITLAEKTLTNNANHKILIILTDGENLQGDITESAKHAQENGLTVYTVGVGTPEGELVPSGVDGAFIKDESGKYVTSKLDEKALSTLSETTGGITVLLEDSGAGFDKIYQQKLKFIPKTELQERRKKVPIERFQWPLMAAFIILLVEMIIGEKPFIPFQSLKKKKLFRFTKTTVSLLFLASLLPSLIAHSVYAGEGKEAYNKGDYLTAGKIYSTLLEQHPNDHIMQYNNGTVEYKNNLLDQAIESFTKSLASTDIQLQEKSYYNLGNTYHQKGLETAQNQPEKTIPLYEKAIQSYDASLQLNSENKAARKNKEIVKKQLEELKQQQKEQPPPKDEKNDKEDSSEKQKDQDKQQSGDKNQTPKDSQSSPEKSGDQQQNKEQNQEQTKEDKATAEDKKQQDTNPKEKQPNKQDADKPNETAKQAQQPSAQTTEKGSEITGPKGQMTHQEASRLLEALKDEEGDLNFVPRGADNDEVKNNW